MYKSPTINSLEEYCNWMREKGLWTNPNYVPMEIDRPKSYPLIVLADYSMDYDSRYRVHNYFVYKEDFDEYSLEQDIDNDDV